AEVEDGIADQLARPMERHVAATLDFEYVDAVGLQQVRHPRVPAERDDRWMLEQQQHIMRQPASDTVLGKLALPYERVWIGDQPGLNDLEHGHGAPGPFPWVAHCVATMPAAMSRRTHATSPGMPTSP